MHKPTMSCALVLTVVAGALTLPSPGAGQQPRKSAKAAKKAEPATAGKTAPRMQLWVPAYYYPNGPGLEEWNHLIASASRAPIVAIVNPNSGPGDHADTNFTAVIRRARKAGLRVVGYVGTQYTRKPLASVQEEIERYLRFYPEIQGIHVDEQSSDAAGVPYYVELYKYVNRRIPGALVLGNPGTNCVPEYIARRACDTVCLFEQDRAFENFRPPAWISRFSPDRFCVQAYQVEDAGRMRQSVEAAARMRIGYVFITDDRGPNPYDRLPSYWDAEVEAVQKVNEAAAKNP